MKNAKLFISSSSSSLFKFFYTQRSRAWTNGEMENLLKSCPCSAAGIFWKSLALRWVWRWFDPCWEGPYKNAWLFLGHHRGSKCQFPHYRFTPIGGLNHYCLNLMNMWSCNVMVFYVCLYVIDASLLIFSCDLTNHL